MCCLEVSNTVLLKEVWDTECQGFFLRQIMKGAKAIGSFSFGSKKCLSSLDTQYLKPPFIQSFTFEMLSKQNAKSWCMLWCGYIIRPKSRLQTHSGGHLIIYFFFFSFSFWISLFYNLACYLVNTGLETTGECQLLSPVKFKWMILDVNSSFSSYQV